jgi:hypothetical protein
MIKKNEITKLQIKFHLNNTIESKNLNLKKGITMKTLYELEKEQIYFFHEYIENLTTKKTIENFINLLCKSYHNNENDVLETILKKLVKTIESKIKETYNEKIITISDILNHTMNHIRSFKEMKPGTKRKYYLILYDLIIKIITTNKTISNNKLVRAELIKLVQQEKEDSTNYINQKDKSEDEEMDELIIQLYDEFIIYFSEEDMMGVINEVYEGDNNIDYGMFIMLMKKVLEMNYNEKIVKSFIVHYNDSVTNENDKFFYSIFLKINFLGFLIIQRYF